VIKPLFVKCLLQQRTQNFNNNFSDDTSIIIPRPENLNKEEMEAVTNSTATD
ncbi:hypothetical protein WUBG_15238, partial [Wuchereria bancrofti]